MYDAIIIGARCAGSPTAMLLARLGYRVLLADRVTFPSDTFRSHALIPQAMSRLKRWGLLDEVIATGCAPIRDITMDMGDFPLKGNFPVFEGMTEAYAPRRKYLDHLLARGAVAAGAELREGFNVEELLWDAGQVVGIRAQSQGRTRVTEHARIVIGADGLHSILARGVAAPTYHEVPTLTWVYYSYWSDVPMTGVEFYRLDDAGMLGFPTNDGLSCVGTFGPLEGFTAFRADIEGNFKRTLARFPALTERVASGRRAERWLGTADLPGLFRKPYGPGWALVGDAGYHKDPVTATGISDAFRDAEFLVEALDAGFSGRQPLQEALATYEQRRNEVALPLYEMTCQTATFGPAPAPTCWRCARPYGEIRPTPTIFLAPCSRRHRRPSSSRPRISRGSWARSSGKSSSIVSKATSHVMSARRSLLPPRAPVLRLSPDRAHLV
ncbi:MAG: NAD(P)/FAD-dependent oxidoreductase [Roseiflexaceae bacterium]